MRKEKIIKQTKRQRAIDDLISFYISLGQVTKAVDAARNLGERKLSKKEAQELIKVYKENKDKEIRPKDKKLSEKKVKLLSKNCLEKISIGEALEKLESGDVETSNSEIEILLKRSVKEGLVNEAVRAARLRGRDLSTKEIRKLTREIKNRVLCN